MAIRFSPGRFKPVAAVGAATVLPWILSGTSASGDLPNAAAARSGDLVFVQGRSIRSAVVHLIDGANGDYSHVGMVVFEDGLPFIVHADPRSATDEVVKEPWSSLMSPGRIEGASLFRLTDPVSGEGAGVQAAAVAQQMWRDHLPFDHDFDLTTPGKLYCTELVWRAYKSSGVDLRGTAFRSGRRYLLPSDLIRSGLLGEVPRSAPPRSVSHRNGSAVPPSRTGET